MRLLLTCCVIYTTTAVAQPSEEEKALCLRLAFEFNKRDMVAWGNYDCAELKKAQSFIEVKPETVKPKKNGEKK